MKPHLHHVNFYHSIILYFCMSLVIIYSLSLPVTLRMSSNMTGNPGLPFDIDWFQSATVDSTNVSNVIKRISSVKQLNGRDKIPWLIKAVTCMDLTSLAGDSTERVIEELCQKACFPIESKILEKIGLENITTASVCVYPLRVEGAVKALEKIRPTTRVNVASVAAGFPSGQTPLSTRLGEIHYAVEMGANEIDIVIDRTLVLTEEWEKLYNEIKLMKEACGPGILLKTILSAGELGTLENVYKTSIVAMMAGSDFIKTSTGKEVINATLEFGVVMCKAIKDYYKKTDYKVGLKPAGGIKTHEDAMSWLNLMKEYMEDPEWLNKDLFRIGASGLLTEVEKELRQIVLHT